MSAILPIVFLSIVVFQTVLPQYIIPQPSIEIDRDCEVLSVSIPDNGEIALFAFSGNINKEIVKSENGTIYEDVNHPINEFWTINYRTTFDNNDVIYYWLRVVDKSGKEYFREDGDYIVECEYENYGGENESATTGSSDCEKSPTIMNGEPTCSGELIFSEDFDDRRRWNKKWQMESKFAGAPNFEFVTYWNNKTGYRIGSGLLQLRLIDAEKQYGHEYIRSKDKFNIGLSCTSPLMVDCSKQANSVNIMPPFLATRVNSKPSLSFRYGKIEIRALLPIGDWVYPQIYLTPTNFSYCPKFTDGEMIIGYSLGNKDLSQELLSGLTFGDNVSGRHNVFRKYVRKQSWNNDFHIFGLEWHPDKVIFSVDGTNYGNITLPLKKENVFIPFDQEMIITLGIGVGGRSIPDVKGKPYKNKDANAMLKFYKNKPLYLPTWWKKRSSLTIDYVRVYAL